MTHPMILAFIALSACASAQYADENYGQTKPVSYEYAGRQWSIYDVPSESRLLVAQSVGDAMGAAMIEGLTFDISGDMSGPSGKFRAVASDYLKAKGCTVSDGERVMDENYEVFYSC